MSDSNIHSNYRHFVVTRFNIPWNNTGQIEDKYTKSTLTDQWMERRFRLFTTYCLPSMLNQVCREFVWLIYFDGNTSESYKQKIENLQSQYQIFHAKFVNRGEDFLDRVKTDISLFLGETDEILITTRLDNDDSFHKSAIGRIQNAAQFESASKQRDRRKLVVNLTKGYCLKVEPHYELASYMHFSNPFISLVERLDECQDFATVLSEWHDDFIFKQDQYNLIQIDDRRYWIQVIHRNNISNQLLGWPVLSPAPLVDFGLDISSLTLRRRDFINNLRKRLWFSGFLANQLRY